MNTNIPFQITEAIEKSFRKRLDLLCKKLPQEITNDLITSLAHNCLAAKYRKGTFSQPNALDTTNYMYYIYSGLVATSTIDRLNGKREVIYIWVKDHFIMNFDTFLKGESHQTITYMLEESQLIYISYNTLKVLNHEHPELMTVLHEIRSERDAMDRERMDLLAETGANRVNMFIEAHPSLLARVNFNVLASYLRMSEGRFSKAIQPHKWD